MTNPDDSAFPWDDVGPHAGLTKREYFAAKALTGLLMIGAEDPDSTLDTITTAAVDLADTLIEKLNKIQPTE